MLIQKESPQGVISISAYQPGRITVSGKDYSTPIVLSKDTLTAFDTVKEFQLLTSEYLLAIIPKETEILLLGSGGKHQFLTPDKMAPIIKQGIAVECMSTRNACHTFQVLSYEYRKVVALLFP